MGGTQGVVGEGAMAQDGRQKFLPARSLPKAIKA